MQETLKQKASEEYHHFKPVVLIAIHVCTNRGYAEYFYTDRTSVVVPYCYLFLLSVFILWFSYYVSDIFCKFLVAE